MNLLKRNLHPRRMPSFLRWLIPLAVMLILIFLNIFHGSLFLSIPETAQALFCPSEASEVARFVVWQSRVPALLTALLAGGALAVSGLVMQTVFANPLADPSILGVNAGASLGAALALLLLGGSLGTTLFTLSGFLLTVSLAFIGAMCVIGLLLLFSSLLRSNLLLLITGVMLSFGTGSLVSLLSFFSTEQGVHNYVLWGMGDFNAVGFERLPLLAFVLIPTVGLILLLSKPLDALLLGSDYALNLGFRVQRIRTWLLLLTGILTAVVTALCGPISFIGLAVPHVARLIHRTSSHLTLLPATLLWGGGVALFCHFISRLPADGTTLPLGAITPLLGVPIVLGLLFRRGEGL